jgi:hypothetical protein
MTCLKHNPMKWQLTRDLGLGCERAPFYFPS